MAKYECDKCGACCRGNLLVEVYDLDVWREPRLADAHISLWTREMTKEALMHELEEEGRCLIIAAAPYACAFLRDDNTCEIYPTRPNVCVGMQAGDEQCQQCRGADGVAELAPVER
jgi:Fe-S-cluster containining protein